MFGNIYVQKLDQDKWVKLNTDLPISVDTLKKSDNSLKSSSSYLGSSSSNSSSSSGYTRWMFGYVPLVKSNSWETISDTTATAPAPVSDNSAEGVDSIISKQANMYDNLIRDVVHNQSLTGNKQFKSVLELLQYADNKLMD